MRQTIAFVGIEFDSRLSQRLQTTSMAVWVEKLKAAGATGDELAAGQGKVNKAEGVAASASTAAHLAEGSTNSSATPSTLPSNGTRLPISTGYVAEVAALPFFSIFDYIRDHLGYRLEVAAFIFAAELVNYGFAAPVNPRPVQLVLLLRRSE
eukprot:gene21654-8585_t